MDFIYPLTIILDRYSGVYSGGKYTAWPLNYDEIPHGASADDTACMVFWEIWKFPVGKGDTAEEAITNLAEKLAEGKQHGTMYNTNT